MGHSKPKNFSTQSDSTNFTLHPKEFRSQFLTIGGHEGEADDLRYPMGGPASDFCAQNLIHPQRVQHIIEASSLANRCISRGGNLFVGTRWMSLII